MRKLSIIAVVLVASIFTSKSWSQTDMDQLIKDFTSEDWVKVKSAKEQLENYEEKVIPKILPLLEDKTTVKLKNTGSLIYPGAEKFFGYGQMIEYHIDVIAIRAGWLLEDLTFNNFGFSGIHLPDEDLENFIRLTFPAYYNNSTNRKKIEGCTPEILKKTIQELSIANVKSWWAREGATWKRLTALNEALRSFDEKRQVKALFYMRNGTTRCTGLTREYYIDNISRDIVRLSISDTKRISENAGLILSDTKFSWLDDKPQQ
jgi:hypothetical protein